ncbi:MAG: RodZ domain-containing protein [Pseudomonadota bacterium]
MELRGFDSYEVRLGDELRGERACRGWTIKDASRELCMKPAMIEAIENADLSAFPNRSVIPGYVRSYARYLGLDANDVYGRFCAESGFESTLVTFGMSGGGAGATPARGDTARTASPNGGLSGSVGADFTASRFAVRPAPRRIGASVSLGSLVSAMALVMLVGGVGYGGWTVLQDIQRVGFVPLPEAPAVVADAPEIETPETPAERRPSATDYADGGALFGVATAAASDVALRRDGPISAIDPSSSAILHLEPPPEAPPSDGGLAAVLASLPDAARADLLAETGIAGTVAAEASTGVDLVAANSTADRTEPVSRTPEIAVHAMEPAWIRVRAEDQTVLFEGTLKAGEQFTLPPEHLSASLRAGNAGGVFVALDGTRYGPLGRAGEVVKGVSLAPQEITLAFSTATADTGVEAVAAAEPARP